MSKFLKLIATAALLAGAVHAARADGDAAAGKTVFKKCQACHAVGEGAKNKVGPELNELIGRTAGGIDGYKYSKAMRKAGEDGLVWGDDTLAEYLISPKKMVKGTRMAFAGLKKDEDVANVIAYLKTFSADDAAAAADAGETATAQSGEKPEEKEMAAAEAPKPADDGMAAKHGVFHLGRAATTGEVAAWDIDVRPDGLGLPEGKGTVAEGEVLYTDNCASCHGVFGEAVDRWPVLAGGFGTLTDDRPVKTIGSYWPHVSTVFDYIRRAMPFGSPRTLSDDDVYAITAFLLYLNDVVTDEEFELSNENLASIKLPNADNFIEDDRASEPQYADRSEPCMSDCKPGPVKVTMRARVLDVTPDSDEENTGGGID